MIQFLKIKRRIVVLRFESFKELKVRYSYAAISISITLILHSCGSPKDCDQPYRVLKRVGNITDRDLTVKMSGQGFGSLKNVSVTVAAYSESVVTIDEGTYLKKAENKSSSVLGGGEDAVCNKEPKISSHDLWLTEESFDKAKLCVANSKSILNYKTENCPDGSFEQKRPCSGDNCF